MDPKWPALIQGVYYFATGIWALLSINTFMKVTGPKTDIWLVKTVGVLVVVIGTVLLSSAFRQLIPMETYVLAIGSALGLAAIDVIYVGQKRISSIYLLDAVAEALLVGAWFMAAWAGPGPVN